MELCGHCHNVLPKTVDRCTVCGTSRVDPQAADVRRRDDGDLPSHAPGWAAPLVTDPGIHPDEFLRELTGDEAPQPAPQAQPPTGPESAPSPRSAPSTPVPGALAGYLGTSVNRQAGESGPAEPYQTEAEPSAPPPPASLSETALAESAVFDQHLSTATRVAPDGVAARTTRLDGTVKLGPTAAHRVLTIGAPLAAGLLLVAGIVGSYSVRTSQAEEVEAAETASALEPTAVAATISSIVRLDLDGCGVIAQTTGFSFANGTVVVPRSEIVTDNRPTVVASDGTNWAAEIQGWSLVRNLAVVRPEERMPGGLEWGVSSRIRQGDAVSILAITQPGVADPVMATVETTNTINSRNVSFELDVSADEGSLVLNAEGFVIGVIDSRNIAQVSDDIAPALSRIVLDNERPQAVCPPPPTTLPPTTDADAAETTEGATPDE